jgi:hypothetical protein
MEIEVNGTRRSFGVEGPAPVPGRGDAAAPDGWCWITAGPGHMTTPTSSRTSPGFSEHARSSISICVGTDGRLG